ncbi:hypothetical protein [Micromonospora sp. NPDC002575]|uniref:hypothetical protein n=1 Tax=Micromonospora sp. NPDC002575 TaxID=3364222 RepID=UPI0036ADE549
MIERGSGRTSGLTDWRLMDLLSMWACIQDHDTAGHWKQVAGWRKVCDLAQAHLGRLKEYRRGLAEAWPPATNAAAQAYLGELDDLIDKVQRTHDAAAANYDALAAATRAISSARAELKPLHDEYVDKLQQKRTYEATAADPKAAMGARVPDKPVTDADLERLNIQARNLMYGLSGELQQAQAMLRQPPTIKPRIDDGDQPAFGSGNGSIPAIPPIIPIPTEVSFNNTPAKLTNSRSGISSPTAPGLGPVLGGMSPNSATPLTQAGLPGLPSTPSNTPGIGSSPILPPGAGNAKLPYTPPPKGPLGPSARPLASGNPTPHAGSPRTTPPPGLIGNAPSTGPSQSKGPTPSRRINPVGGVIGGGGAGTAPGGAAGSRPGLGRPSQFGTMSNMHPLGPAWGTGNEPRNGFVAEEDQDGVRRWDPDHPWETERGVSPIVRPPDDEGPINPGPAIGFDR